MEYSTQKSLSAGSIVVTSEGTIKDKSLSGCGADYSVNIKDKTNEHVSHEIKELTYASGIEVVLDTVGLENPTKLGFDILPKERSTCVSWFIWKANKYSSLSSGH